MKPRGMKGEEEAGERIHPGWSLWSLMAHIWRAAVVSICRVRDADFPRKSWLYADSQRLNLILRQVGNKA